MRAVVLGAGGFVGGWICEALAGRPDVELVACVRKWASATRLARRGVDIVQADLDTARSLAPIVADADLVVNAAMLPSDREAELALRLYSACKDAGVGRYVQLSSAAVYGDRAGEVSEDTPPRPFNAYGRGKVEMEARLLGAAAQGGPQLTILRPSIVYGPFSGSWTIGYAQRIAAGRWLSLGRLGAGTCNLVHAHDLARAVIAAATADAAGRSNVLNINGPDIVSWNEYIERFGDALEIADRTVPGPAAFAAKTLGTEMVRKGGRWLKAHSAGMAEGMRSSAGSARTVYTGARSLVKLYPGFVEIRLWRRRVRYSWQRAADVLGFQPSTSLGEGLRQSALWCRRHGVP